MYVRARAYAHTHTHEYQCPTHVCTHARTHARICRSVGWFDAIANIMQCVFLYRSVSRTRTHRRSLTHTPTQANPKLHGDEWFQDLKARLERMHQEASAKKRPAKDKGRSKGGKHQDSVSDVPVRACIHFIHGETPHMVEWRVCIQHFTFGATADVMECPRTDAECARLCLLMCIRSCISRVVVYAYMHTHAHAHVHVHTMRAC